MDRQIRLPAKNSIIFKPGFHRRISATNNHTNPNFVNLRGVREQTGENFRVIFGSVILLGRVAEVSSTRP